ncbi:MAG: Histone deacetylase-like amidohydrolase [Phycisphaerae bacterium]|nr:Histone deacetylase-like amidohydrolase [Phycisphaerae bacterium]
MWLHYNAGMGSVGLVCDEVFKRHDTGPYHPERPARLDAIAAELERSGLMQRVERLPVRPIDDALLLRVHERSYIDRLVEACRRGKETIDCADSTICRASDTIARLAAGAVADAARAIGAGRLRRAFCAIRPPGHHCERDRSMGFCLINNVAVAARVLRDEGGFERVAILDWDVHHGNGTQHIFEADPTVLFISLHGHPAYLYPGTGYAHETGVGAGAGYTLNIPLMPGADDATYRNAFEAQVIPALEHFEPQVLLISAGFDAHRDDPLADMAVSDAGFTWMTSAAVALADRCCSGRILSVLEGGYDLAALARCVRTHVELFLGA